MSARKEHCTECNISMIWTPGGYGTPDAQGRCFICHRREVDAIGRSMDAMVSGPRLAAQVETLRGLLAGGGISHSRAGRGVHDHTIWVYRYDTMSPSGFMLAGGFDDRPEITALLRGGLSPLSPTEAR